MRDHLPSAPRSATTTDRPPRLPLGDDLVAVLDAAYGRSGPTSVPELLDAVGRVVACDVVFWDRFRVAPQVRAEQPVSGRRPVGIAPLDPWVQHLPEHPIACGRYGPVVAVSDVLSRPQFLGTWLYQEAFRPDGILHEIGVELPHGPDEMSVVQLSREPGPDFDDHDHELLRLLRPHVAAALHRLAAPSRRLTPRQLQVLRLVREGMTDRAVASRLGTAEATVGKHLEQAFSRLGARSRAHALHLAATQLDEHVDDDPARAWQT